MTSRTPDWERVKAVFQDALARPREERARFVGDACADDVTLRREVESLLAAHAEAGSFAERPPRGDVPSVLGPESSFGPYRILHKIDKGGMGEVYRARDTKLGRDVALKVLPRELAGDPDRAARLEREARLLAALNHPHIATIHGIEESGGTRAIVMELVDGPTLRERLARGPLRPQEALRIAAQIADALAAAHDRGIIHRDLKPENVKLAASGAVKVLDFGLAKPIATARFASSPGMTAPSTVEGTLAGTPAYMSPEQARGQVVDRRTDSWAFGCVLYEMLSGRSPFAAASTAETLVNVLEHEPDWTALPADLPPSVRTLLRRCLQKDHTRRLRDIADGALELEDAIAAGGRDRHLDVPAAATPPHIPRVWNRAFRLVALAVAASLLVGVTAWNVNRSNATAPVVGRFSIPVGPGQFLDIPFQNHHWVAVSPNGTHIVFTADNALWLRPLGALEAVMVQGTANTQALSPFFSADGQWIGFHSGNQLHRVALEGGPPEAIGVADRPLGATWGPDDRILYGQGPRGIWEVAARDGTPQQVIAVAEGEQAHGPQALPNGSVLFTLLPRGTSSWNDAQVVVQARGSGERTTVIRRGRDARYLSTGHLVYAVDRTLQAIPFDVSSLRVEGDPVSLIEGLRGATDLLTGAMQFGVAANGTLVYAPVSNATSQFTLAWVNRQGREEPLPFPASDLRYVRVAPDRRRIVRSAGGRLWVSDSARPSWSAITSGPNDIYPLWTRDSREVVFMSVRDGVGGIFRTSADGSGPLERLIAMNGVGAPHAWTPDGRGLVFAYGPLGDQRLGLLQMSGVTDGERTWKPLIDGNASVSSLSPDGRWLAYTAPGSGPEAVYVQRFPELVDRHVVSDERGGWGPLWSPDGRELYYRRFGDGAMMSVRVDTASTPPFRPPEMLFPNQTYHPLSPKQSAARFWDLASDGRFLMVKERSETTDDLPQQIIVVVNWLEELQQRVPTR